MKDLIGLLCPLHHCALLQPQHRYTGLNKEGRCDPRCDYYTTNECIAAEAAYGHIDIARQVRLLPLQLAPLTGVFPKPPEHPRPGLCACEKAGDCAWQRSDAPCPPRQALLDGLVPRDCL